MKRKEKRRSKETSSRTRRHDCGSAQVRGSNCSLNSVGNDLTLFRNFMLPESKNPPTVLFQGCVDRCVASAILLELPIPKVDVRLRTDKVVGAAVPLTAINENGDFRRGKDKVRAALHFGVDTVSEPESPKGMTQKNLRLCITAANPRHAEFPLLWCEYVGPGCDGGDSACAAQVYSSSGSGSDRASAGPNFRAEMSTETLSA